MFTIDELLKDISKQLKKVSDDPQHEARWILSHVMGLTSVQLISRMNEAVSDLFVDEAHGLTKRRVIDEEPLGYVLESAIFMGHKFTVKKGVLIPRPETELLVDFVLPYAEAADIVLECGFGSGVISISLGKKLPDKPIYAWDVNPIAYDIAKENSRDLGVDTVNWLAGDFFKEMETLGDFLDEKNILLVSNPPYIPTLNLLNLDESVKAYEPFSALDGGDDGLDYYRKFIELMLKFKGKMTLACEIGSGQDITLNYLVSQNPDLSVEFEKDFAGHSRIMLMRYGVL